ncbi:hypothetical protein H2198_002099 [Neophaeococcomyces mojaviensis]|uniref:Uncharacterized protein n=1 Tax=Neophaeococcomyces mojaviensis TaxID=3383035 RepID=A0ACC3AFH6_9EURO|nr:hypothetical protein H2198_002099 [Knufia sp. JES_112]
MGNSWLEILEDPLTRKLLGHDAQMAEKVPFISGVQSRLKFLLQDPLKHLSFAKIGYTALEAFLQANCTGPPLEFDTVSVIFPEAYLGEVPQIKQEMIKSLSIDGIDIYSLAPHIELFWLAKAMMDNALLAEEGFNGRRARFRVNFWHQKLLSEMSDTLKSIIHHDADVLDSQMTSRLTHGGAAAQEHMVEFLVERANMRAFYGDGSLAREDLLRAAKLRNFEFALTGAMGKRTKFQEKDVSQLVVMAKSQDVEPEPYSSRKSSRADQGSRKSSFAEKNSRSMQLRPMTPSSVHVGHDSFSGMMEHQSPKTQATQPENIPLNHDTLLEDIQFKPKSSASVDPTTNIITDQSHLPITLAFMDPAEQPLLFPMDSIILLTVASSITNTQASDGLTREETLPYATRVLEGGSSNWSVYTQALLVRSRIEAYQSKTAERGLLQLQALVDQVIAETTGKQVATLKDGEADANNSATPSTFLPRPTQEESATVAERLRFIHQISPPYRWELEAELAARWTAMGGLRSALEIYERLQMHAEVALCLAATDNAAEATSLLKKLLFVNPDQDMKDGDTVRLQEPQPADTPRLLCILGDLQQEPKFYTLAWTLSSNRYARAQRSLGTFYLKKRDPEAAVQAYFKALQIARQDLNTWFSLGCVQLELEDWRGAIDSFTRVVQLEDRDAQGWSNLAVALLRLPAPVSSPSTEKYEPSGLETIEESTGGEKVVDPLQHTREALRALRRAANLQRDDARIWDNYLTVAASIPPDPEHPERSTPWQEVIHAMSYIVTLRHKKEGESCVDLKILEALIDHVTNTWDYPMAEEDAQDEAGTNISTRTQAQTSEKQIPVDNAQDNNNTTISDHPSTSDSHPPPPSAPRVPFLIRATLRLIDTQIAPLATSSPRLFLLLSRVALWRHRPAESLSYIEKYWRATTTTSVNKNPADIIEATKTLVNGYQTLGPMERERTGGIVEKGWKFKSRTAIRSAMSKAKGVWDDKPEYTELEALMGELKNSSTD